MSNDFDIIHQLGFDVSTIVDMGDYFLVEEDISIPKENMEGYKELLLKDDSIGTRQARTNRIISSYFHESGIKIDASLNNNPSWRAAILEVMQHYNNLASQIYMYEVTSNPDITLSFASVSGAWAVGEFPTADGKPGQKIRISNNANNLSLAQKVFLVAHEMGHNIGLRHTDYLVRESVNPEGAIHIPGTPTGSNYDSDPNSVFNSGSYNNGVVIPWNGFSNYDKIAIRYIYPLKLNITGYEYADLKDTYSYTTSFTQSRPFQIEWDIPSGAQCTYSYNQTIQLKFSSPGTYNIKCRAVYDNYATNWTVKSIEVFDIPYDNLWQISNLKTHTNSGNNQVSYDLVRKQTSYPYFDLSLLEIILLYNGTYNNSMYSGDWSWTNDHGQYVIPTTVLPQHGSYDYWAEPKKVGNLFVKRITSHRIYGNYTDSDIEIAVVYTSVDGDKTNPKRYYEVVYVRYD